MKKLLVCMLAILMLSSCAANDFVAKVDNIKISQNEFNFYLASIKEQLSGTELQTEEDWQTQEIEGKKAIDVAKQRALEIAKQNAEYIVLAKKAGLKLSADEKKQVEEMKKQVIQNYGGDKQYKEFLKENKLNDKFIKMMCESTVYFNKIGDKVTKDSPVTDDEIKTYYDNNRKSVDGEIRKAKHILLLTKNMQTGEVIPENELSKKKALAEELLQRVENGEDFDSLMNEYTEDPGTETNPDGYIFGSGEMVPEFEQATDSLGFDEVTLCESDYGYHIIKRLQPELSEISDKIEQMVATEKIQKWVSDAEKEYGVDIKINDKVFNKI